MEKEGQTSIGINIGYSAGTGIDDHIHYHIVPRCEDDHNFITVLAEVRTIPEHIGKSYDWLLSLFQGLHRSYHV